MTVLEAIQKVVKLANAQVGYKASKDKHTKYTADLDALGDFYNGPKQWRGGGADWCDIFYDWLLVTSFGAETGRKMLYQPKKSTGAGCGFSANFYRKNNAFTKVPQVGAQIFYGPSGNESHTGIVVAIEDKYIWTVEGNTGGGAGEVQKKKVSKSANISGYGIPDWKLAATEEFTPEWGIDISAWQGDYDLARAKKEGVKFVIIKAGGGDDGLYKDSRFEQNYKKAKDLKLPVGVYWFSKALNNSDATKEAKYLLENCLKGKQFELPIYIDVENRTQLNIGKRKLTDVIQTWLKYLNDRDYWVGIYSSTSAYASYMYDNELNWCAHWVADWRGKCYYPNQYGMWQFGGETNPIRSKKVAGQTTDQNYMYQDYPKLIKEKGKNGYKKGTPTPTPTPSKGLAITGEVDTETTKALQKWVGSIQDGYFSGQLESTKKYTPSILTCEYNDGYKGSGSVANLQKLLIKAGFSVGSYGSDGYWGKDTVTALQRYLNAKLGLKLTIDGILGTSTAKGLQQYLNKVVYGV